MKRGDNMGKEFVVETLEDMCGLMCDNRIPAKKKKRKIQEILDEIMELAKFHSVAVPMVYGDGTETTDNMVSLEELGRILAEIEDGIKI